jgi:hypothetical protein
LTGDLLVVGGQLQVLSGPDALAQKIAVRLRTFLGEWIFDTGLGTPWFQNILGTRRREALVQSILRSRIENTQGVVRVLSLNVAIDGTARVATVTGSVLSEGGDTTPVSMELGR